MQMSGIAQNKMAYQTQAMGSGKGQGQGMRDVMQQLTPDQRAQVRDQMAQMDQTQRRQAMQQMKQLDAANMSNQQYFQQLQNILNPQQTTQQQSAVATTGLNLYA